MGRAVVLDPVNAPGALQLVELCAVKARQNGRGVSYGRLPDVRIVQRQPPQNFPMRDQALAHGHGQFACQLLIHAPNGLVKVADTL